MRLSVALCFCPQCTQCNHWKLSNYFPWLGSVCFYVNTDYKHYRVIGCGTNRALSNIRCIYLNSKPVESGIHWARPNLRFSSSTPQKSKPTSPNRDFSPSDHKKLLNGNQLPKLWFLPISIGLLFAVTYPYCSLKLLFVHPARTTLRAFKSPISKAT